MPTKTTTRRRLTIHDLDARAEACEECADHLDLDWTDLPTERTAGKWLARNNRGIHDHT